MLKRTIASLINIKKGIIYIKLVSKNSLDQSILSKIKDEHLDKNQIAWVIKHVTVKESKRYIKSVR